MQFLNIENYVDEFIELWNNEFDTLPMHPNLVNQCAISSDHIVNDGTKALVINHKFIGLVVSKIYQGEIPIDSYYNTGFISFIFVRKEERNKGYGSKLLELATTEFKKHHKMRILLGMDLNTFFPGIPESCDNSKVFFEKKGFKRISKAYNLLMSENPEFKFDEFYENRLATLLDKVELLEFIKREFSQRWYFEAYDYFQKGGSGREFAILLDHKRIIGFARINDQESLQIMHNINWSKRYRKLGGIGPLGVAKANRGNKLGSRITNYGTQVLFDRGCSDVIVDWTGINAFYEKSGFKICDVFLGYELTL
ncbi:MAG: family N-acetyltransferase [Haloplasmataceae bacterium]|jgi:GNAT superfamily N-acetyltransferase|nr:family N-acetyltransferase [Haloplasmataceae bacterium]